MKEKEYQHIVHPIDPVYDTSSKVLILGSFPSVKSREYSFFYGHPQNRMWKVLGTLLKEKIGSDLESKKTFLLKNHIAMWDVIKSCDIVGSSDSSIKNVKPTDLFHIVTSSSIKAVFCNGGTSYTYYQKYHEDKLGLKGKRMPSTSSANARYSLDDLTNKWKEILNYI